MPDWELNLDVEPAGDAPLFLRIARAISEDVRRGRLRPGDELPGSRTLARSLSVHRNTVLAAYRELEAEGWISSTQAKGTFVSRALPDPSPRPFARAAPPRAFIPEEPGFELPEVLPTSEPARAPPGALWLGGGVPDVRLVPVAALSRAYRRALKRHVRAALDYADPRGQGRLREALAAMVSQVRGLAAAPDNVLVTRGSQMALYLLARTLVTPGDAVAVEALGYRPAWDALRQARAKLVPLAVDGEGLDVDALEKLSRTRRLRAVYVTPHHQYPTTRVLSAARRLRLLELARTRRFAVIEDDYDHEFHYDGRPVLPLASADRHGVVVYVGTLSKLLAPGLRIGFAVAPRALIERLAGVRAVVDRQGDQAVELAVAELLEDGEVQRHARRAKRAYEARRDAMAEALKKHVGDALEFELPSGGMALWTRTAEGIDPDAWVARGKERGVYAFAGSWFTFDGKPTPNVRLGFAALAEPELREAVKRLAAARPEVRRRRASG